MRGLFTATLVFAAPRAFAYEVAKTEAGAAIHWNALEVPFEIDAGGSDDLTDEAAFAAVRASFASWTNADCSPLVFRDDGVSANLGSDRQRPGEVNAVMWIESGWTGDPVAAAVTTLRYDPSTGELVDTDIRINGARYSFSAGELPLRGKMDLRSVVTHEVGHVHGLAHSRVSGATMSTPVPEADSSFRDLEADDISGLCDRYPIGFTPIDRSKEATGCACTHAGPSTFFTSLSMLGLTLLRGWVRFRQLIGQGLKRRRESQ